MIQKLCVFIIVFLSSTILIAQHIERNYKRAKITYNTFQIKNALENAGIPIDHGIKKKGVFIIADFSEAEIQTAQSLGADVDIIIEDLTAYYQEQYASSPSRNLAQNPSPCSNDASFITPSNYHGGSMGGFLTYQEILNELDEMRALYPNLITAKSPINDFTTEGIEPAGYDITPNIGGNSIQWVRISDNPDTEDEGEPQVLYNSLHHAREPASMQQLIFYMWYLLENYDSDPEIKAIVDNTELVFVPVVNPDGYLYNQFTNPNGGGNWRKNRKNTHGVDNNRNYDYFINGDPMNSAWGGSGSSDNPNSNNYRGTEAFSEAENQAIRWLVEQNNFAAALNNHSRGNVLLYPFAYSYNTITPEHEVYQTITNRMTSQNGFLPMLASDYGGTASGAADDFMYGTVDTHDRIFSLTPEIATERWPDPSLILGINESMMYLNLQIAKMVNSYAKAETSSPLLIGNTTTPDITYTINSFSVNDDFTNNFEVSIEAVSANITNTGNTVTHTNLFAGESSTGNIILTLDNAILPGEEIIYDIIVNGGAIIERTRVTNIYGDTDTTLIANGDTTTGIFTPSDWGTSADFFVSSPSSITDSPFGNYQNSNNSSITLGYDIDLSTAIAASINFYARWDIEDNWDYVQFEISTNGGNTWIPQCGNFTTTGTNIQPLEPLYDGLQDEWILEQINLSDYIGESITARFHIITDTAIVEDGFYFDDLEISIINDESLSTKESILEGFTVFPNPVKDFLTIQAPQGEYTATIYNIQGQRVSETTAHIGNTQLDYSTYANGIYFVKIVSNNALKTIKVIKQ